ncbi:MAG: hypothetical protein H0X29_07620 [Parachlamydiaceae bacterium]|nr:hypothetical protein [Parachlamydiaceae bacterium]
MSNFNVNSGGFPSDNNSFSTLQSLLAEMNQPSQEATSKSISNEDSMLGGNREIKLLSKKIKDLFIQKSDQLIGDLILHPDHKETYRKLGSSLRRLDENVFKEFQSSLGSIQKIASLLRKGDGKGLNTFTNQTSRSSLLQGPASNFFDLHLPANINQVRSIGNPEVRIRVMAQLINRDKTPLKDLNLDRKELMLLAPHLTYVDCLITRYPDQDPFKDWPVKNIDEFLNACSPKVESLFINSPVITQLPALPNCTSLNCSFCITLRRLPPLPNCVSFNCSFCKVLAELPVLSNCVTFECSSCDILAEIPALPNCEKFICWNCQKIQQLPALPNCVTLKCFGCDALTRLPALPNCVTLECYSCAALPELPALPNCVKLDCSSSILAQLPPLPNCKELKCNYCNVLTRLPALPNCEELNCMGCNALTLLPALPNCVTLTCVNCNLTELPDLPNCSNLLCRNCVQLTHLPALPSCLSLNCGQCSRLIRLPALPNCVSLDCPQCEVLEQLPPLPNCNSLNNWGCRRLDPNSIPPRFRPVAPVNTRIIPNARREDLLTLRVNIMELNENPINILFEIAPHLLQGGSLPQITFIEVDGKVSQGLDVMGLRRSFVSRLMSSLAFHAGEKNQLPFIPGDLGLMPFLDSSAEGSEELKHQIKGFQALGALFVRSLEEECTTGNIFDPTLFQMITSFSYEELIDIPADAGNLSDNLRLGLSLFTSNKAVRDMISFIQENPSNLRDSDYEKLKEIVLANMDADEKTPDLQEISLENKKWVQAKAKESLLGNDTRNFDTKRAVAVIAKQMCLLLGSAEKWNSLCRLGIEGLQNRIEGSLSREKFMSALTWDPKASVAVANVAKIKGFVDRWVKESTKEDLKNLVFTITGSNTLVDGKALKFEIHSREAERLPEVHSCFSSIEIAANYPDYETFKEKLKFLIEQSTNKETSGFQFS